MGKNLDCNCLCHGSDGNYTGDSYFSCIYCYAANHMERLTVFKQPFERDHGKPKGPRKPRREAGGRGRRARKISLDENPDFAVY